MQTESKLLHFFQAEHDVLKDMFEPLVSRILRSNTWDDGVISEIEEFIAYVHTAFEGHLAMEEELLFPTIVKVLGSADQSVQMLYEEHQAIRNTTGQFVREFECCLENRSKSEDLTKLTRELFYLIEEHLFKESLFLYPLAEKLLSSAEKKELMQKFQQKSYQ